MPRNMGRKNCVNFFKITIFKCTLLEGLNHATPALSIMKRNNAYYTKKVQYLARAIVYRPANVIASYSLFDAAHAMTRLTNLANYSVQQFLYTFILF